MAWAQRRRAAYLGGALLALAVIAGIPAYFLLSDEPSCSDGVKNQGEAGVDCGGSCQYLCPAQVAEPNVLWARSFAVADGVYNAVAYVENPNFDAGAREVSYRFRLFDDEGLLITERRGTTFLSPRQIAPIFEPSVTTGERTPARTFFSLTQPPRFEEMHPRERALSVAERTLRAPERAPRLEATIRNRTVEEIRGIEVVATIFDPEGNAFAASRTVVEALTGEAEEKVVFTWPEPFEHTAARIDIVPRVAPPAAP